jgi:hypothetical protein
MNWAGSRIRPRMYGSFFRQLQIRPTGFGYWLMIHRTGSMRSLLVSLRLRSIHSLAAERPNRIQSNPSKGARPNEHSAQLNCSELEVEQERLVGDRNLRLAASV